jgi:hypothetical protein
MGMIKWRKEERGRAERREMEREGVIVRRETDHSYPKEGV